MVAIQETAKSLEARRQELGMTHRALAKRSGVSLATVKRVLSGAHGATGFVQVAKVAEALGLSVEFKPKVSVETLRERQALRKAERIASLTQATSSLESQGLDKTGYERLVRALVHRLMADSNRKLWADQ